MQCFKCNLQFQTSNHLILHLKHDHHLKCNDRYECVNDCRRTYNSLNSYRKHLNAIHFSEPIAPIITSQHIVNQNVACITDKSFELHEHHETEPVIDESNSNCNDLQTRDMAEALQLEAEALVMTVYSEPHVPRRIVQLVTENVSSFFENTILSIKDKLHADLQLPKNSETTEILERIDSILDSVQNPFTDLSTEHRRLKLLKNKYTYTPPRTYTIGEVLIEQQKRGKEIVEPKLVTGKFIPLGVQLKAILEIPGLLREIKQYLLDLQSDDSKVSNFVQGDLWKSKIRKFGDKTIFPLFIYFDEYETGNPLGSHSGANKLGAVYASLACMPPKYASSLKSILLVLLFFAQDRKDHGNKAVFKPLLDDLEVLRNEGVTIVTDSGEETVFFCLGILLGDNLGFNTILGLNESFSSKFYCRLCKADKEQCQTLCRDDPNLMRTRSNYESDLALNDPKQSGLKESCIWHILEDFHMSENVSVDLPHDFDEGIVGYVMSAVINALIFELKLFTLETLNFRIQVFDYGRLESNEPRTIKLKTAKEVRLKMSAAESLCFVRYFGFMVGDLVPSNGNQYWDMYILLRQVIDLVTAPSLTSAQVDILTDLLAKHHALYCQLFPDRKLTPKFHFATHYPRVIRAVGPPMYYSSLRYESRHRLSKLTANVSCSRVNIIHTLAIKYQLQSCNSDRECNWSEAVKTGPFEEIGTTVYNEFFRCIAPQKSIQHVSWIDCHGTKYSKGSILLLEKTSIYPVFGEVIDIFMVARDIPYFLVNTLRAHRFDRHFWGYEVIKNQGDSHKRLISFKTLPDSRPCSLLLIKKSKTYVTTRYTLS